MRASRRLMTAVLSALCAMAVGVGSAVAQDAAKVAPNVYKVLIDNDHVRLLEVTLKPGGKVPMHSHPASVVYPLSASRAKFTLSDGKSIEVDLKPGEASWHEAETHASENIGTAEARVLVIELKGPSKKHEK